MLKVVCVNTRTKLNFFEEEGEFDIFILVVSSFLWGWGDVPKAQDNLFFSKLECLTKKPNQLLNFETERICP